mgnify:CR=1 FL=1
MKRRRTVILLIIIVLLVGIQFIPVDKPVIISDNPNDLLKNYEIPENISNILRNACYDCHSNETNFPWYSYIYPIKIPIYNHIHEGRDELNFSEWDSFKKIDKLTYLDDISSEVSEGDMPLKEYIRLHSDEKLSEEQIQAFINWSEDFAGALFE